MLVYDPNRKKEEQSIVSQQISLLCNGQYY